MFHCSVADLKAMQGWEIDVLISVANEAHTGEDDVDFDKDPGSVNDVWKA